MHNGPHVNSDDVELSTSALTALIEALPDSVVVTTVAGRIVAVNNQLCTISGFARDELVGRDIEMLIPTRFRAEHVAQRAAYIAEGGQMRTMSARPDIVLVRADGRELPVDVALSTTGSGAERVVVASVRDATMRREHDLAREREYRFLAAMNELTVSWVTDADGDGAFRTIAARARSLVEADLAYVVVPADNGQMRLQVVDGAGGGKLEGALIPRSGSVAGALMRDPQPLLLARADDDPRMHRPDGWPEHMGPVLFVPLHARDETLGALTIAKHQDRDMFRPSDVTLMRAFAAHATIAILDARAQQQLRRFEVLEDRDRVAVAMHDNVINRISSASLTLHTVLGSDLPSSVTDRLSEAVDELDAAIAAVRDAVFPR
jgi:PAS domain S-box-containing protein